MNNPAVRDAALLLLRVALGVVFIAHGWDKVFQTGADETAVMWEQMNIPQATLSVWVVSVVEMLGGALLILGMLTPAAAGVLALDMVAAFYFVHLGEGIFVTDGGAELVLVLFAACVVLVVFGAGRASLDKALSRFG
ncbi:MAG TPA: DoxX family protein [Candidatus Corynebacterium faecigallinarum]|uniref:DoxX family protein n=1 Tax=Candidatus Corynebacterium faecigallinarum TaxID=2838528 RepID=A0A9D2QD82_9CORY|nr:DoxX family protein [Candidatus Corynebacterium faecigallinarum]